MTAPSLRTESGFSLIEMLIAMGVLLVVLAGTAQVMSTAIEGENAATQVVDMNGHLRAAMDLIQRDLLQTGQGLPVGRRIGIPNGPDADPITRPGPGAVDACPGVDDFPDVPSLPAVTVGPGLGPPIDGECTDVITILAADNLFGDVSIVAIAADSQSAIIHENTDISDDPDVASDNLRPGDLLMIQKGVMSSLVQVTDVNGQTIRFDPGAGDPLGLNQFDINVANDDMQGTLNRLRAMAPANPAVPAVNGGGAQLQTETRATRIRMVTYFADTSAAVPRLMRVIGGGQANAVAIGVQAFRLSYDIADQVNNPTSVRMDASDLSGTGACPDDPSTTAVVEACSENQIRKVNVVLSMRAAAVDESRLLAHGNNSQSTLYAQVSLRSLAFVDRYQ
jgi:prepilin-type N-terminal cleavage/methylation domain-containing protein